MDKVKHQLREYLMNLSDSDNWEEAWHEWEHTHVDFDDNYRFCPCGMKIKELCYLRNNLTNHEIFVGNQCVTHFDEDLGDKSTKLFIGIKAINNNPLSRIYQADLIKNAEEKQVLLIKDKLFLLDLGLKRKMSKFQEDELIRINKLLVYYATTEDLTKEKQLKIDIEREEARLRALKLKEEEEARLKILKAKYLIWPDDLIKAYENNKISNRDYKYILDINHRKKESLSPAQLKWYNDIIKRMTK